MEVWSCVREATQRGRINAGQLPAEPAARTRLDRAHVVKAAQAAVGKVSSAVAGKTLQVQKVLVSILARDGRTPISLTVVALRVRDE